MKDFNEYVLDWFQEYLDNHQEQQDAIDDLFEEMGYENDLLEEGETKLEYLQALDDADVIYQKIFGYDKTVKFVDDLPDTETFLTEMFLQCADTGKCSFVKDFVEDMACHADGYNLPSGFFKDLAYGGCVSGMIGMLVYNTDCKKLYIEHIDDMEAYKEELEDDLGEPIRNTKHLPHYTFMCWLCYEELAYSIGRTLFPNTF